MSENIYREVQSKDVHSLQSLLPFYRRIPSLDDLTIQQTANTIRVCNLCRGGRTIAVKSQHRGTITYSKCMKCNGAGTVYD